MSLLARLLQRRSTPDRDDATRTGPELLDAILARGNEHLLARDLERAKESYAQILELDPHHALAHHGLSAVAAEEGDGESAIRLAGQAVGLEPDNADFHVALARIYVSQRQLADAVRAYQEAVRLKPDMLQWRVRLAAMLIQAGRLAEALTAYSPGLPDARAYFDLGDALLKLEHLKEAEEAFQQAVTMAPDSGGLHFHLARVRRDQGRPVDAEGPARSATVVAPDMPQGWFILGSVLARQARHVEAVDQYRKAISLQPDNEGAWGGLLFSMNYSDRWSAREVYEAHVEWGRRFPPKNPMPVTLGRKASSRRIRIGYLSPDYWQHAVSHFIEPVLQHHDRTQFEVFCYHTGAREDSVTARLKDLVEHWRSVDGTSDDELEAALRQDDLDILVELSGHTDRNRLGVLARRIAPVQVTYLGYPNTTGLAAIDYRVTDARADPPGESDELNVEKLVRLNDSFLCYSPRDGGPGPGVPPFRRKGHITFGSFNTFAKISPTCIKLWTGVLSGVPESKLFIKTYGLQETGLRTLLLHQFAEAGIGEERVLIAGPTQGHGDHMRTYGEVDIALDTFPYHGTTTTLDALWMGVPVITLAGDRHASRVGVSILSTVGLTEFVAQTPDQYVATAVKLAGDADELEQLRGSLRERLAASPLTDGRAFTAKLEAAYLEMWNKVG